MSLELIDMIVLGVLDIGILRTGTMATALAER